MARGVQVSLFLCSEPESRQTMLRHADVYACVSMCVDTDNEVVMESDFWA